MAAKRQGILAGGNFIVDYVKVIDAWPEQDTLASILSESRSNGGGPFNVLKDLAALGVGIPLEAMGLVGDDADGAWILEDCAAAGIGVGGLGKTSASPTSYTDAMTDVKTGRRTFFHQRGANAELDEGMFHFEGRSEKVFLLGYLLLLDRLDVVDARGITGAARVLERARAAGMRTAVEFVSARGDFRGVALASLGHADVFLLNEFEAGQVLGRELRPERAAMAEAAEDIAALGACGDVVIHCPAGVVAKERGGGVKAQGSVALPNGYVAGATGAGDAFTSGYLLGWHGDEETEDRLTKGVCVAAASLSHPTPSGGVGSLKQCMELGEIYGYRQF